MKLNRRHVLLLILLLSLVTLFLPIKVHYSFESTALVYPLREWNLKRGQDDAYISELVDNRTNAISHLKNYKFERGDVAEVDLSDKLIGGVYVADNDTIAKIHSFYIDNEITKLKNLKAVEENALKMSESGEKDALIQQAHQRYEFAREQLALDRKNYVRQKLLFEDSIVSQADFEIVENSYRLAEINVEIAQNELQALKTGSKPEEQDYIRQRIDSYEREIQTLKKMQDQFYIVPPISGIVSYGKVLDGIITISDTSNYILKIPVKVNNIQYLQNITSIRLSIPGYDEDLEATFLNLEDNVNLMANQQIAIAKALIPGGHHNIYPGMAVQCRVVCDKISLYTYLQRGVSLNW
jgi:hypothetical protein